MLKKNFYIAVGLSVIVGTCTCLLFGKVVDVGGQAKAKFQFWEMSFDIELDARQRHIDKSDSKFDVNQKHINDSASNSEENH